MVVANSAQHPGLALTVDAPFQRAIVDFAVILASEGDRSPEAASLGGGMFFRLVAGEALDRAAQGIEPPGISDDKRARAYTAVEFFLAGWRCWGTYLTRYTGPGALLAMLNAKISAGEFMSYADLIATMLAATPARDRLERPSLLKAFETARYTAAQVQPGHPVWSAVTRLFPEIFDSLRRAELDDLQKLPLWAGGTASDG